MKPLAMGRGGGTMEAMSPPADPDRAPSASHALSAAPPRMTRLSPLALVLIAFAIAAPAHAQFVPSASGSWMSAWPNGPPTSGLTPWVWVDQHGFGYGVGGTLALDLGGPLFSDLRHAPTSERPRLEVGAFGAGPSPRQAAPLFGALSTRLHVASDTRGAWLASSGAAAGGENLPLVGGGAWLKHGQITFTMQVVHFLGRMRVVQPQASASRQAPADTESTTGLVPSETSELSVDVRLLTGAETAASWTLQRLELQSRVGIAVGVHQPPAHWGEMRVSYWARPSLALFARARSAAEVPAALEPVRGNQAAVGIQLAPGRGSGGPPTRDSRVQGVKVERLEPLRYRIVLRTVARSVEVSSDATGWTAVAARRLGLNWWEAVLPLTPGIHRIAMRVDGGVWIPPPGIPTTLDEFGGQVGLIVVE